MRRGFAIKEAMLGCGVLLVVAAVVGVIAFNMSRKHVDDGDIARMRQVYVGLSNYGEVYDGLPAPTLVEAEWYILDPSSLLSDHDPYAKVTAPAFPDEPGLPRGPRRSTHRISFSYLWAYPEARKASSLKNPMTGVLADEWIGTVRPLADFDAEVEGPVLRLTTDGSLVRTSPRPATRLGGFEDLFVRR